VDSAFLFQNLVCFVSSAALTRSSSFLLCNSCVLPGSTRTAFYPLRSNTALMNHASTDDAAHDMKPIAIKLSRLFDLL
jgi:hypothetical protein